MCSENLEAGLGDTYGIAPLLGTVSAAADADDIRLCVTLHNNTKCCGLI